MDIKNFLISLDEELNEVTSQDVEKMDPETARRYRKTGVVPSNNKANKVIIAVEDGLILSDEEKLKKEMKDIDSRIQNRIKQGKEIYYFKYKFANYGTKLKPYKPGESWKEFTTPISSSPMSGGGTYPRSIVSHLEKSKIDLENIYELYIVYSHTIRDETQQFIKKELPVTVNIKYINVEEEKKPMTPQERKGIPANKRSQATRRVGR